MRRRFWGPKANENGERPELQEAADQLAQVAQQYEEIRKSKGWARNLDPIDLKQIESLRKRLASESRVFRLER